MSRASLTTISVCWYKEMPRVKSEPRHRYGYFRKLPEDVLKAHVEPMLGKRTEMMYAPMQYQALGWSPNSAYGWGWELPKVKKFGARSFFTQDAKRMARNPNELYPERDAAGNHLQIDYSPPLFGENAWDWEGYDGHGLYKRKKKKRVSFKKKRSPLRLVRARQRFLANTIRIPYYSTGGDPLLDPLPGGDDMDIIEMKEEYVTPKRDRSPYSFLTPPRSKK